MNYRKLNTKALAGGLLAIFAGFAFAPIYNADATFTDALFPSIEKIVADDEQPAPAKPALKHFKAAPQLPDLPQASDEQAIPGEPQGEPHHNGSDGRTTFAVNDIGAGGNALGNHSDAHIFGLLGAGGGSSLSPTAHKGRSTQPQQGGSSEQNGTAADTKGSDDHPSDKPADPKDELAQNDTDKHDDNDKNDDGKKDGSNPTGPAPTLDNRPVASVPEPSSLALVFIGVCGLIAARRFA